MSLMAVKTVCKLTRVPRSSTVASGRRKVAAAAAAALVAAAALHFPPIFQHATATVRYEPPPHPLPILPRYCLLVTETRDPFYLRHSSTRAGRANRLCAGAVSAALPLKSALAAWSCYKLFFTAASGLGGVGGGSNKKNQHPKRPNPRYSFVHCCHCKRGSASAGAWGSA
jgi:hypothetical protein